MSNYKPKVWKKILVNWEQRINKCDNQNYSYYRTCNN